MMLNPSLNQILSLNQTLGLSPTPNLSLSVKKVEFVRGNQTVTP